MPAACDRYRIGDGYLEICSADAPFRERLAMLYRECAVEGEPETGLPRVRCTVRVGNLDAFGLVTIEDDDAAVADPVDQVDFILGVFPDRGYSELPAPAAGWRMVSLGAASDGAVAVAGQDLLVDRRTPWRALAGSLAVSRLIRRQRRLVFLHAASAGVRGEGVLIMGPKGAGKTTLSLALAARGHRFLGDEIAGVRVDPLELVPVRRSLAIRAGPRARAVDAALAEVVAPTEVFPDGSERRRAQPADLFPGANVCALPLRHLVFLRGFGDAPRLETVQADRALLRELTPIGATMWGAPPLGRTRDLLALLSKTRAHALTLGDPDESAALLEQIVEG
jgi:hypothetical protein